MSHMEELKLDLPRLRALARSTEGEETASWSRVERIRFDRERRWCIEALEELAQRLKAATPSG